jgi:biopolymer transport protein TolR
MGSSNNSSRVVSEINVTPLVDVMLVLLIMFMVTAPLMQQGIEVDLPKTAASGVSPSEDPLTIVVDQYKKISIAKQSIDLEDLKPKLNAIFTNRKNKQVYLRADKNVSYGFVTEVMAEIRAAGITNIGLITLPKDQ